MMLLPQQYFLPSFLTHFPSVFRPYFLLPSLPAQERVGELQLGSSMCETGPKYCNTSYIESEKKLRY